MINAKAIKPDPVASVKNWLINSGIQSAQGGFYAWIDLNSQEPSFLYSEITGYAITTLLFLNRLSQDTTLTKRAQNAAGWLAQKALHPCGGFKARLYQDGINTDPRYSFDSENIFSFDTAMALYGLANLYKQTQEEELLAVCRKCADFLINKMQNPDGSFNSIYSAKTSTNINPGDKWSNQPGSFHAKIALGLVDLFEITKEAKYKEAAIKICEFALTKQDESGRFITDDVTQTTHLHPHSYTIEGLIYTGAAWGIKKFIDPAQKAVIWMFKYVDRNGINDIYDPKSAKFSHFQRSDILAQALRLGLIFNQDKTVLLKARLENYQYLGENYQQSGGFLYNLQGRHLNSWCAMFASQALVLERNPELISQNKKVELFI